MIADNMISLPREQWKGAVIPMRYTTEEYYDISMQKTADGKNFDAFMGIELVEGGLASFGGKFYESEVFEDLPETENEAFTGQFDAPAKRKFPG